MDMSFEQTLGVGDGQGSLVCCSPWGQKESDMTEWLNWTEFRPIPGVKLLNYFSYKKHLTPSQEVSKTSKDFTLSFLRSFFPITSCQQQTWNTSFFCMAPSPDGLMKGVDYNHWLRETWFIVPRPSENSETRQRYTFLVKMGLIIKDCKIKPKFSP